MGLFDKTKESEENTNNEAEETESKTNDYGINYENPFEKDASENSNNFSEEDIEDETALAQKSKSVIADDMFIKGDITTAGNIEVFGDVKGKIQAEGSILIQGKVKGNVKGEKIGLYGSAVKGNIIAKDALITNEESLLLGNVKTENAVIGGRFKGNVKTKKFLAFKAESYYLGDVTTTSIAVEPGAIINGNIKTVVPGDIEAPFDEEEF